MKVTSMMVTIALAWSGCHTEGPDTMSKQNPSSDNESSNGFSDSESGTIDPQNPANSQPGIGGQQRTKLAEAREPEIIIGSNLTFGGGRARCTSTPVSGTADQHQVTCSAVEIVGGREVFPSKLSDGLSIAWQTPTASTGAGFNVVNCSTTAQNLHQNCLLQVATGSSTVDVLFKMDLSEVLPTKATRTRTAEDVVTLPYAIMSLGYVAEVPILVSSKAPATTAPITSVGALRLQDEALLVDKAWLFAPQRIPLGEFPLSDDAQVLECGGRLYLTSRSRLFVVENGAAKHIAGSINARNLDDLSHPLRTYWAQLASLACNKGHVLLETRQPERIYDLSPEGVITMIAKDHLEVPDPGRNSIAADSKGNIYYLDGQKIRRRTPSGTVEVAYDGSSTFKHLSKFVLDENSKGDLKAFVVLETGENLPIIVSIDASSGVRTTIAGKEDPTDSSDIRDGVLATKIDLKPSVIALAIGRNSLDERIVLISEGGDHGYPELNAELLAIDSQGIAHVLLRPAVETRLRIDDQSLFTTGLATIGTGSGGVTLTSRGEVLAKVSFTVGSQTTTNLVTMPIAGGPLAWAAGRLPSPPSATALSNLDPAKVPLGKTLTAFGTDGKLYVIDNTARVLYRVDGETLTRLPVQFEGDVLSATIARDSSNSHDRLVYVEAVGDGRIQELQLSSTPGAQPQTLVASPGCDIRYPETSYFASVRCSPRSVAVDSSGRIVFYDFGYHYIRRRETLGTYTIVAGTQDLSAAALDRSAGSQQPAESFGLSLISTMRYDASGALYFVEQGGYEQYNDGAEQVFYKPVIGKLDKGKITVMVGAEGTQPASELVTKREISTGQYQLTQPEFVAPLPDGGLLFSDGDIVLMHRGSGIKRFFGGRLANADCGTGTIDRVAMTSAPLPTLSNALGRFCSGRIYDVNAARSCSGGKVLISLAQRLAMFGTMSDETNILGSGSILRLEAACGGANTL